MNPTTIVIEALESRFAIRLIGLDASALERFRSAWGRCIVPDAGPDDDAISIVAVLVTDPATAIVPDPDITARSLEALEGRIVSMITTLAIERRAHDSLLFHAAGLADHRTGRTVALVGPSGRGKTTASRVLAGHLGYVTDETLCVSDDLTVIPYPKPLSLVDPGREHKRVIGPDELGLRRHRLSPLSLRAVVLLDRVDGLDAAEAQGLSFADAAIRLVEQMSHFGARHAQLARLRSLLAACEGAFVVRYTEAEQLLPVVRDLLRVRGRRFVQQAGVDVVDDGDRLVVLRNDQLAIFEGIVPEVWRACSTPGTLVDITATVVERHGHPASGVAEDRVREAARALVAFGILRQDSMYRSLRGGMTPDWAAPTLVRSETLPVW